MSDLWCMSAATFRRFGKIEQARGAIQEAEVRDGNNPAVWVQVGNPFVESHPLLAKPVSTKLGLYHHALGDEQKALQALHKALFIAPENVSAIIHICKIYLSSPCTEVNGLDPDRVELAAGLLSDLTNGGGWDVPEAWYYLAKAAKMQGRVEKERECLIHAVRLAEVTRVREISDAVGWSL
jgi:cytochrome c-type biogenesis protein CcmH/NrfG